MTAQSLIWNDQIIPDGYKFLLKKRNELLNQYSWGSGLEWDTWRENCKKVVTDWIDYWTDSSRTFPDDWIAAGPNPRQVI